ncbi:MAG: hypothetical protein ACRYGA_02210 [Janthinobacterium lividum]
MRALIALIRQWEFSLSAMAALVTGAIAAHLLHIGDPADVGMAGLCAFTCIGCLWSCLGFGRVSTVHLRLLGRPAGCDAAEAD